MAEDLAGWVVGLRGVGGGTEGEWVVGVRESGWQV
jgi:hypothetical protein